MTDSKPKRSDIARVVLVGDGACGKTCLLEVYKRNKFPTDHIPTVVDNFSKTIQIEDTNLTLNLWDTAGQEEYDSVRPLAYRNADLIFLCFSIESRTSLQNVEMNWVKEVATLCPGVGMFIVGLKSDIRDEANQPQYDEAQITRAEEGMRMKEKVGAIEYYEVSSKTRTNVNELFDCAGKWLVNYKRKEQRQRKRWYFCYCC